MPFNKEHPTFDILRSELRESPKDFVAVVGAGLSRPCGFPSWVELRDKLINNGLKAASNYTDDAERNEYISALKRLQSLGNNYLWTDFYKLKTLLGKHLFNDTIANSVVLRESAQIPISYDFIWQLNIKGIISFNIDACAPDSYAKLFGKTVDLATAKEPSIFVQFLTQSKPFVFFPHGRVLDPSSWVFTSEEVTALLCDPGSYTNFMRTLCQTKHLIILGFNPLDFSFKYLLQHALFPFAGGGHKHFALLDRPTSATIEELRNYNTIVLPYSSSSSLHPEVAEILGEILNYLPSDPLAPSVYDKPTKGIPVDLSDENKLLALPTDELRDILNQHVSSILPIDGTPTEAQIRAASLFYLDHIRLVNDAWLVRPNTERSCLYGYRTTRQLGQGAFGTVYECEKVDVEERAAVKILQDINMDPDYLNSFRQGVNSMKILTRREVNGMVKFLKAYEVPACIFMEIIDGSTLREVIERRMLTDLSERLESLCMIGEVVNRAHNLEERVLHRDLKPENIMFKNKYSKVDDNSIIVLDFDLSWHRGANKMSVVHGVRAQGYAAPEQTSPERWTDVSTRHTGVDTFGLGMLAFFILLEKDPLPNQQNFADFQLNILQTIRDKYMPRWKSLPLFLSQVIRDCTYDYQSERIDFWSALQSFRTSLEMSRNDSLPKEFFNLALLELAYRISPIEQLDSTEISSKLTVQHMDATKSTKLELISEENMTFIKFNITKVRAEYENRNVQRYLEKAKNQAVSALKGTVVQHPQGTINHGSVTISGQWELKEKVKLREIDKLTTVINKAIEKLQLS